jgi:hypothetical protein
MWPKKAAKGVYTTASAQYQWAMRVADVDLILVPGWIVRSSSATADPDHWISRWERNLTTARWLDPGSADPVEALLAEAGSSRRPVIVVTHGTGVEVLLAAGEALGARPVIGGFVVAPVVRAQAIREISPSAMPLGYPSVGIVPDNNPAFSAAEGNALIESMGGHLVQAGNTGPIDNTSGQGPWPEGLMRLGWFLKQIRAEGALADRRRGS